MLAISALRAEPARPVQDNPETAIPLPEEVASKLHEETQRALIDEVGESWRLPQSIVSPGSTADLRRSASPIAVKLDEIVFPNVSFARISVGQAVATISAMSEEFDQANGTTKGVNVLLLDPEQGAPEVSLTLRNVTLRRVLDFLTEAVGYSYEVQADAVVVRPEGKVATLETEFFSVTRAAVLRMSGLTAPPPAASTAASKRENASSTGGSSELANPAGNIETAAMRRFLQLAGVNFDDTPGATMAYDGAAIIATQTPRNLDRIRTIVSRYREVRQVEIEAKFMEVQEGALEELGLNWSATTKASQLNAGSVGAYTSGNRSLAGAFTGRSTSQQGGIIRPEGTTVSADGAMTVSPEFKLPIINNAPQMPGATELASLAGPVANLTGVVGEFDVNAVVRALSQRQGTDLLSAPRVTVLSGNPATITVAQEMRYPQSFGQTQSQVGTGNASGGGSAGVAITAGTPQEFVSRNVGVELKVTPTVEDDNHSISLELNPRVTEFDGFVEYGGPSIAISGSTTVTVPSGFYQPIFSVRDISTKVTIWDGATLVMGGLTREEVKKVSDKVPVLGDIPVLGRLFRSKGTTTQKRNLLIFVKGTLVNPGGAPLRAAKASIAPIRNPLISTVRAR
ncbi:MAG: type and secretion system protein [Verrucomicrobia bacterium]|nr:type and secretion system protein [Verrucomicrobiota bacterium]